MDPTAETLPPVPGNTKALVHIRNLQLSYGTQKVLENIHLRFLENRVTALIGPSGCGKTSLLRCLNRMNDLIEEARISGTIEIDGLNIHDPAVDIIELRKWVGMVFQRPNPFPKSIFENIAYGIRLSGIRKRSDLEDAVESSLRQAALWDEVKDRLETSALQLSGGQQQRLCIARAIAIQPRLLLMDEPASALDPIATSRVESLILELRERYTILIVTHNMQQAARISDETAFFYQGRLVEFGATAGLFTNPRHQQTEDYVTGRFG